MVNTDQYFCRDLTYYMGHPEGSEEEFIALTNPKLNIEVDDVKVSKKNI